TVSLVQLYVHVVYSTKHRTPWLKDGSIRRELHRYLHGACRNQDCPALAVGGVEDHVHLLVRLGKTASVANLVKEIKTEATKWIRTKSQDFDEFRWQSGYGGFSVSPSHLPALVHYIENQEEHHKKENFQDEFRRLLRKYGVEWDERYAWE